MSGLSLEETRLRDPRGIFASTSLSAGLIASEIGQVDRCTSNLSSLASASRG